MLKLNNQYFFGASPKPKLSGMIVTGRASSVKSAHLQWAVPVIFSAGTSARDLRTWLVRHGTVSSAAMGAI